jgi:predicted TIM-barrel fold metal-dependent hydrolase
MTSVSQAAGKADNGPALLCDCHFHVFGPADLFPYAPGRSYTPEDELLFDYEALAKPLGIRRAVVVQPSVYGCDNHALVAALAETAPRPSNLELRGVAAIETAMTDKDLEALHRVGVRAGRYNLLFSDGCDKPPPEALARRVVPLGWHLEFCLDLRSDSQALSRLSALEVPCVIDHFGHLRAEEGSNQAAFQSLLAWLKGERGWLKLSAPYRCSSDAAGGYDNLRPLVEELVDQAPNRLLWGSDWPHPQAPSAPPALKTWLAKLESWIGKERLRRILVDNPVERYGFTE